MIDGLGIVIVILALAAGIVLLIKYAGFQYHISFLLFIVRLILVGLMGLASLSGLGVVIAIASAW